MESLIHLVQNVDLFAWLGAITALLGAIIAIAQLIPGEQPEKSLQAVVDFLSKFSRK
jgi:hypothetical protein